MLPPWVQVEKNGSAVYLVDVAGNKVRAGFRPLLVGHAWAVHLHFSVSTPAPPPVSSPPFLLSHPQAEVVDADLEAGEAVVHIIDRVLLPLPLQTAVPLPEDITAETPTAAPAPTEVAAPSSAAAGWAASGARALAALAAALLA